MAKRSVIVVVLFIGLVGIWIGGCQTQEQKVERLITELGHKETKDRNNAARALGSIGEGAVDALPALIQLLQDQDEWVRINAAWHSKKLRNSCQKQQTAKTLISKTSPE